MTQRPQQFQLYDNRGLSKFLVRLTQINALISVFQAGIIIKSKGGTEGMYATTLKLETNQWVLAITIVPFLINMILFLQWKYRSTSNVFSRIGPQTITPAGAVYWYFVPVAWFWKPYEAMLNLKNAYHADGKPGLALWWLLFWASIVVPVIFGTKFPEPVQTMSDAGSYILFSLLMYGAEAASLWIAADVVKLIASAEAKALGQA